MNKEVFDSYFKLNDTQKSELKFRFKDSPVGLRFLSFLEQVKSRNFKNTEAVSFIYDSKVATYNVLENRYFKLRKKVLDELNSLSMTKNSESVLLADEEKRLYTAKIQALAENKEAAYKQLSELEKECWEKNIFELLPTIIDLLIFLNQSFNRLERNKTLFIRYEKAIQLLFDIQKLGFNARLIYEINFSRGIKFAQKQFTTIKEIALKNKDYPRFEMCYHHISLYYKLGSANYYNDMQVISRHLSAYKKLYAQNPLMPLITYRVNYVKYQHFHYANSVMFYHFNRCEFNEALSGYQDVWDMVHEQGSAFSVYKTESLYSNMFTLLCMTEKYEEANLTSDMLIQFLKENNQTDSLPFAYSMKVRLYTDLYPNVKWLKMDKGFLFDQLNEYIKRVKKDNNSLLPYDQAMLIKFRVDVLEKKFKAALATLKDEAVQNYLKELGLKDYYAELIQLLIENSDEKWHSLMLLNKKLMQLRYKIKTPSEYNSLNWLIRYCKVNKQ